MSSVNNTAIDSLPVVQRQGSRSTDEYQDEKKEFGREEGHLDGEELLDDHDV